MKRFLSVKVKSDNRGSLVVIEKVIPFKIKRLFYLYDLKKTRGEHYHKKNKLALFCINGECEIKIKKNKNIKTYNLKNKNQILLIYPNEWHSIHSKKKNTIIFVFASEYYDKKDYFKIPV